MLPPNAACGLKLGIKNTKNEFSNALLLTLHGFRVHV